MIYLMLLLGPCLLLLATISLVEAIKGVNFNKRK
jgi:hypothetical protein